MMGVACWAPRCSFVDFEGFVVSGRQAEADDFPRELVDIVVGVVCCEKLGLLGGR